jgi:hypothetical protein
LGTRERPVIGGLGEILGRPRLEHRGAEVLVQRHIERIEPDDRVRPFVGVRVPRHAGRDDEVALAHPAVLAVHHRGGAGAFEHEPQRIGGMPMGPRIFARHEHLQAAVEIGGGVAAPDGIRIGERQHATLGVLHSGDLDRLIDQRPQHLPLPVIGPRRAVGRPMGGGLPKGVTLASRQAWRISSSRVLAVSVALMVLIFSWS